MLASKAVGPAARAIGGKLASTGVGTAADAALGRAAGAVGRSVLPGAVKGAMPSNLAGVGGMLGRGAAAVPPVLLGGVGGIAGYEAFAGGSEGNQSSIADRQGFVPLPSEISSLQFSQAQKQREIADALASMGIDIAALQGVQ
ncbi:MAG: hypothetical protein ACKV2Q_36440 [Planctomycetaceae bacterium]